MARGLNVLPFIVFGNLVFAAGFVIILQYVAHDFIPLNKLPWAVESRNWAKGLCTAVFAFEGWSKIQVRTEYKMLYVTF